MTAAIPVLPVSPPAVTADLDWLRLPMPGEPFAGCDGCAPPPPGSRLARGDEHAVGWYRWILGHQLVFCVWRLMCDYLSRASAGDPLAELYDAYTALLLYAGSCTEPVYAATIRSRMAACHPGFTGTWARDHERLRELLSQVRLAADDRLKRAVRFNRLVHMAVARRLVPSGGSLRHESGNRASVTTDADRDRLDWFFRTERAPVCRHEFDGQLTRRIVLALTDIATRPVPARYDREEINRFQAGLAGHIEPLPRLAALAPSAGSRDD
ncbi:MAG TPA: L-tyrosine 3-hydroxylase [Pseudonocardiaceae bacterium]|nr:L-tyrosine 3-hydroxylase [Pseudonocardiaceae bacterium]